MTFRDVAGGLNPAALYIADDLADGEVPDSSGNGRAPLVLFGPSVDTADKPAAFGQSLLLDGVDDYMETAYEAWLDTLHSDGTNNEMYICVVCRWGHDGNNSQLDNALLVGRNDRWWGIRKIGSNNETQAFVRNDSSFYGRWESKLYGYLDGWVAMAARYQPASGGTLPRLDVDGVRTDDEETGGTAILPGGPNAGLIVGANRTNNLSSLRRWWRGRVAAVLLLDYEPTSQQRLDLAASIHTEPSDFDPANLAATVDGDTVSLSWDASPLLSP